MTILPLCYIVMLDKIYIFDKISEKSSYIILEKIKKIQIKYK